MTEQNGAERTKAECNRAAAEKMMATLSELGFESELVTYPNPTAIGIKWQATNGIVWKYDWYGQTPQALSTYMHYSPEQAIAATAGVGTCKLTIEKRPHHGPWIYHFGCGYDFWQPADCPMPVLKHCPNCGRRITKEETE